MGKKRIKILLIEDDEAIRGIVSSFLAAKNYIVVEAVNGREGLFFAENNFPDLVISDIMMPVMDGFEVLEKLKANPQTTEIPFIFLTSVNNPSAKRLSQELGASDFLQKPFQPKALLKVIENITKNINYVNHRNDESTTKSSLKAKKN
jgi:CheY-like chemotaxis protein